MMNGNFGRWMKINQFVQTGCMKTKPKDVGIHQLGVSAGFNQDHVLET
jgi:hypothetical protein